ncbi:MAG TPA: serine/threonine-protein kinase [Streptosporangiaceae bacterium]|nr:serine/threonine-protein kinase [Streptosporangiaceae bacterium]
MNTDNRPAIGDFPPGSRIAGYQIEELIGRGGMAVVYRAADVRLDRLVALKVLAPELTRDAAFRQRFIRESRSGAAVDHPNVIPVFEAGESEGVLFIAMRYVAGRDVRALIDREGPLRPARVVSIVTQIASALDTAHAHGLVHRDVKPANMLLGAVASGSAPDHVYLSDFGLSKMSVAAVSLTGTGQFLGTLDYMAPEQVEGRPIDGRTDLYALACATFEMLTGRPPFQRDQDLAVMWAQVSAPPPSVRELRPELPPEVDRVITKALAKAPDQRHASCLQFAAELRDACTARPSGGAGAGATGSGSAGPPTELAGAAGSSVAGPAATELAFAAPPSAAPHPPVAAGHPHGAAGPPANEATITEAAIGGGAAGGAAAPPGSARPAGRPPAPTTHDRYGASGYGPPPDYGQGGYGQGGYGQGGYRPAGQTDQHWGGSGWGEPHYQGPPPRKRGKAVPVLLGLLALAVLAGAAVLVLHLRGNGSPHTGPTSPVTVPSTPRTSGGSGSPSSPATPASPDAVLTQYYDAINSHHYKTAYRLNSYVRSTKTFAEFKAGFAGTQHDTLTITGVNGGVVSFDLNAAQTDGSVKTYQGTYTIRDGQIVGANVTQTN